MGDQKGAGILWCDFTHNPWQGCTKVSAGCKFCYADAQDKRFGESHWGPGASRKFMSDAYWQQPLQWNADVAAAGVRARVFCASMADVFEKLPPGHPSAGEVEAARQRLWELIEATPSLDWLLLTKRPEEIHFMVPPSWWGQGFPDNVWIGTSVEDQKTAEERIPHLLKVPARVRFLSCEPLLGPVDVSLWLSKQPFMEALGEICGHVIKRSLPRYAAEPGIDWIICGGESGRNARPMHPNWARALRDQCQAADVPYFFKQWGAWKPLEAETEAINYNAARLWEWQGDPRVLSINLGKHEAGRLLDGRTWDEFPAMQEAA